MAKATETYECEFCGKPYKTLKGALNHEKKCKKNPEAIAIAKAEKEKKYCLAEIEEIRQTATSPQHLIQLVEAFLLSKGIKLTLQSYPCMFNEKVSNSHDAPRGYKTNWCGHGGKDGIPNGYPGWHGQWSGSVEVVDPSILGLNKNQRVSFWDINRNNSRDFPLNLWYLVSGGGSGGGGSFNFKGILWLYDFPKMHEEYTKNGSEFDELINEYTESIKSYHEYYDKERQKFVDTAHETRELERLTRELDDMRSDLFNAKRKNAKHLQNEYNKKHGYELPLPPTAFINNSDYIMSVHTDLSHRVKSDGPDVPGAIKRIEALTSKIRLYVAERPEEFI